MYRLGIKYYKREVIIFLSYKIYLKLLKLSTVPLLGLYTSMDRYFETLIFILTKLIHHNVFFPNGYFILNITHPPFDYVLVNQMLGSSIIKANCEFLPKLVSDCIDFPSLLAKVSFGIRTRSTRNTASFHIRLQSTFLQPSAQFSVHPSIIGHC